VLDQPTYDGCKCLTALRRNGRPYVKGQSIRGVKRAMGGKRVAGICLANGMDVSKCDVGTAVRVLESHHVTRLEKASGGCKIW
jgi:hypothetical protein